MLIILIFYSIILFIIIIEWVRVWVRVMGLQKRARACAGALARLSIASAAVGHYYDQHQ